jgi:hypothetical protein
MYKSIHIVFGYGFGDSLSSPYMDIVIIKIPVKVSTAPICDSSPYLLGRIVASNQVVYHIRMSNTLFDRFFVAEIHFHEDDTA